VRKIKRRARQLKLSNKQGAVSYDNMIELMKREEILKDAPHRLIRAAMPLHQQDKEFISYISENIKFIPETLMEKADFIAMEAQRRTSMKDEHFSAKKMHLNHAFKAFASDNVTTEIWSNWIPKLCGSGGMMCHQSPKLINDLYKVVLDTADGWVEPTNKTDENQDNLEEVE